MYFHINKFTCINFFIVQSLLIFITLHFQQLDLLSPFQLYFNPTLILTKYQIWRFLTTFLFFGNLGFNFLFNMIFTYRYCRMLEEGSFRGRTADFVVMFVFGAVLMIVSFLYIYFLNHYICSKKKKATKLNK